MAEITPVRLCIVGIGGRMGTQLAKAALADARIGQVSGVCRPGTEAEVQQRLTDHGIVAENIQLVSSLETQADTDVVIEFTYPEMMISAASWAVTQQIPFVSGTTGLQQRYIDALKVIATKIPVFWASNMSVGVHVLQRLVKQAAQLLPASYDIEITEMHHRHKMDAPSGTALTLGQAAAAGRGTTLENAAIYERYGQTGAREAGSIGFSVQRGGGVIGDHLVQFASEDEVLSLSHRAIDRALFARGAIDVALWLLHQSKGYYGMDQWLDDLQASA